ncbi:MAG: sigma-70 family RNA polymerase sigma factor [Rhodospirillales bacterium]|nr:sigma-70 family RNA polymerase sigma factor [Rhodospirillales bacterium]
MARGEVLSDNDKARRFRDLAMPHLDAAYNLARWLTRNDDQAQDVVQEAYLRAFRYFDGFRGGDPRAWLLKIVRRASYDWLETVSVRRETQAGDDADDESDAMDALASRSIDQGSDDPETLLLRRRDTELLNALIAELPVEYREVLVLREIEDLSYREIAEVAAVPIGTVMSRLARARGLLRQAWRRRHQQGAGANAL